MSSNSSSELLARVGDDIDQDVGLHLVLRCLEAGQQRDALRTAGGEPRDSQRLDVASEPLDAILQDRLFGFQALLLILQHLEVGLCLEKRRLPQRWHGHEPLGSRQRCLAGSFVTGLRLGG